MSLPEKRPSIGSSGVPPVRVPMARDPGLRLYHQRSEREREKETEREKGSENTEEKGSQERGAAGNERPARRLSHASNGDMDCD